MQSSQVPNKAADSIIAWALPAPAEVGEGGNTELPMGENSAPAAMGDIMLGDMNPAPIQPHGSDDIHMRSYRQPTALDLAQLWKKKGAPYCRPPAHKHGSILQPHRMSEAGVRA